ncbi:MAG TPA: polyprenyl synthetase family protein [Anaerolineales bacterium]|nr:polyprenyl synthetase family protein [Anaerolineales bacterium]
MDTTSLLSHIELELQKQVARLDQPLTQPFHEILTYHMGWTGEGAGPEATGKRIRPLLVLLTTAACGTEWKAALPAAAAIELVHNFSLLHDDIQDNSLKRRGRDTAWVKWGMPLAINAGDALFMISNEAMLDLIQLYPAQTVVQATTILNDTCLDLTRGQFLDISYEERFDLTLDDYWPMISGKTAALLAACCHIGALLGGADQAKQQAYKSFGHDLGLAFQVQDDILGIWGDEVMTGKSTASDLVEGKNSLPILYGVSQNGKFAARWKQGPISIREVSEIAEELRREGGYDYAQSQAEYWTESALKNLRGAKPQGEAGNTLLELANKLLNRKQ